MLALYKNIFLVLLVAILDDFLPFLWIYGGDFMILLSDARVEPLFPRSICMYCIFELVQFGVLGMYIDRFCTLGDSGSPECDLSADKTVFV